MKKRTLRMLLTVFVMTLVVIGFSSDASALTLKRGVNVSAVCNTTANTAVVNITGVTVKRIEKYNYDGVEYVTTGDLNNITFDLSKGDRFSFMFEDGGQSYYPTLANAHRKVNRGAYFLGNGVDVDANPDGSGHALIITCQ